MYSVSTGKQAWRERQRIDEGTKMRLFTTGKRGLRVLLVDGNVDVLELLTMLLQHYGHEVRAAKTNAEGFRTSAEFRPHAIFTGVEPIGKFDEIANQMRHFPGGEKCMVVALIGYAQREDSATIIAAGFDHCLMKPANIEEIVSKLALVDPLMYIQESNVRVT